MLTLEQIQAAIMQLSPEDLKRLSQWFFDLDYQKWDEQLEKDIAEGKSNIWQKYLYLVAVNFSRFLGKMVFC